MTSLVFANNATTTLAGAITNTATTFNVAAGGGALFPTLSPGEYFVVTLVDAATGLNNEIMWCTGRSGDTFTVVRGQENTVARSWIPGDIVSELWTAGQAAAMQQTGTAPSSLIYYGNDTGSVNQLVATVTPSVSSLTTGSTFEITPLYANTDPSVTLNVSSLGAQNVYRYDGSPLLIGDIQAAPFKGWFTWDATATKFLMQNPCVWKSSPNITFAGVDSGAANAYVVNVTSPPAPTALVSGQSFRVKIGSGNSNTGNATLTITLQGGSTVTKNIKRADGSSLQRNDIVANEVAMFNYDGTNMQLAGVLTSSTPPRNLVTFQTHGSGNFTVPAGIYFLFVRVVGAGGGGGWGGYSLTYGGGGGGAGGYSEAWLPVTPGQVISYIIGQGGAGGTGPSSSPVQAGTTTFSTVSATGGWSGQSSPSTCAGGAPGIGSGGTYNAPGGYGNDGSFIVNYIPCGVGGASAFGGGGRASTVKAAANATSSGSGGGGIYNDGPAVLTDEGGDGADGAIFIQY